MLAVSKNSHQPTTFYALAFCIHVVAYVILVIGMFTPYWSQITEQTASTLTPYLVYDKGLIVSCTPTESCTGITDFSQLSDIFLSAFILAIIAVVCGFLALQLFCAGLFIRSCRESNLGVPIATMSIFEGALLALVLVLFEISVSIDVRYGTIHRKNTFGFSRGLIVGAIVLYLTASLFIIGEYMRRTRRRSHPTQRTSHETKKRNPPRRSNRDEQRERDNRKPNLAAPLPPPYTRHNPVYNPDTEERRYSASQGMRPCQLPGCEMCSFVTGSPTFWGPAGVFNITDKLACLDSKVVYAIICVRDDKVFIGHSQKKLVDTFSDHLANMKAMSLNDPVAFHFTRSGHSVLDLRVSTLTRINCNMETRARLEKALSYDMDRPHNSYYGINENFEFL